MLLNLIGKEIKSQLKNVTFYLLFLVVALFYVTQFMPPNSNSSLKPKPLVKGEQIYNTAPYGFTYTNNPQDVMNGVYNFMSSELQQGKILSYKTVIGKHIKLSETDRKLMKEAMEEIAPLGYVKDKLQIKVSYKRFQEIADKVDKELGGATMYSSAHRRTLGQKPKTYQEAVQEFDQLINKDKLTNAYGRIFSDYMGITAGFFPVFLAAFVLTKDKRSKMQELIGSRKISSLTYVFAKFIALSLCTLACYLVLAGHATYVFERIASANNYAIDHFAFLKYTLAWILPTILFTISMGMLVSVVVGNGIVAIPLQFLVWMTSLMPLMGDYRLFKSIIRFNELGNYSDYIKWFGDIALNRLFFVFLSIAIVGLTSYIWSLKRGVGYAVIWKFPKRNKVQS